MNGKFFIQLVYATQEARLGTAGVGIWPRLVGFVTYHCHFFRLCFLSGNKKENARAGGAAVYSQSAMQFCLYTAAVWLAQQYSGRN